MVLSFSLRSHLPSSVANSVLEVRPLLMGLHPNCPLHMWLPLSSLHPGDVLGIIIIITIIIISSSLSVHLPCTTAIADPDAGAGLGGAAGAGGGARGRDRQARGAARQALLQLGHAAQGTVEIRYSGMKEYTKPSHSGAKTAATVCRVIGHDAYEVTGAVYQSIYVTRLFNWGMQLKVRRQGLAY
jgi:hypothetical protein